MPLTFKFDSHLGHSDCRTGTYPSSWKVHHFEFVRRQKSMCLRMSYRNHMLSVAFQGIRFHVLPGTLIEMISKIHKFLSYRSSKCPHSISQCYRRALIRSTRVRLVSNVGENRLNSHEPKASNFPFAFTEKKKSFEDDVWENILMKYKKFGKRQ